MILDDDDRRALKVISSISRYDEKTIIEMFRAVMQMAVIEILRKKSYDEDDIDKECSITIPGVCKLKMDYYDSVKDNKGFITEVEFEAKPKKAIVAEINAFLEGEDTPDLRKMKAEIKDQFKVTVGLE